MTDYEGYTHKFTIYGAEPVDCYLKVGHVGAEHWESFPHLSIGNVCFLDLTISKQADELRVYETLFELANRLIQCGGTVVDVCEVLAIHRMQPFGTTSNPKIPTCQSISDYVARYLLCCSMHVWEKNEKTNSNETKKEV
jgi:hypothetical protein